MPPKTSWAWGQGEQCEIRGSEIWMGRMDPWGGNGASCSLREFLDGKYTWHLPDDVRREALAAVQEILGDARPLPDAVLGGDQSRLDPEMRAAVKQIARADRAANVESARLAKKLTKKDLPHRQCPVCLGLYAQYRLNRSGYEKVLAKFPHARHAPALATLDRKMAEFGAAIKSSPLEDCEICRDLPDESVETSNRPFSRAAERVLALPALTPFGPGYRQCPTCGRLYVEGTVSYEWNETPSGDDPRRTLQRKDIAAVRDSLRWSMTAHGEVPEWVERTWPLKDP